MGTAKDRNRAKKAEKKKKKRAAASKARAKRMQHASPASSADYSGAPSWPWGPCYAGQDWHETGAKVPVVLSRAHEDGRHLAVLAHADFESGGLTSLAVRELPSEGHLNHALVDMAEEGLVAIRPTQAWRLLVDARGLMAQAPPGFETAAQLAHDLDPDRAPYGAAIGTPEAPKEVKEGWVSRMLSRLLE